MFNIRNNLIQITQGGTFQLPTGTDYLDYLDIDVKIFMCMVWILAQQLTKNGKAQ